MYISAFNLMKYRQEEIPSKYPITNLLIRRKCVRVCISIF